MGISYQRYDNAVTFNFKNGDFFVNLKGFLNRTNYKVFYFCNIILVKNIQKNNFKMICQIILKLWHKRWFRLIFWILTTIGSQEDGPSMTQFSWKNRFFHFLFHFFPVFLFFVRNSQFVISKCVLWITLFTIKQFIFIVGCFVSIFKWEFSFYWKVSFSVWV